MSTSRVLLVPEDGVAPTTNPATLTKITSGGAAVTNGPVLTYNVLEFNDTTDQHYMWNFRIPDDYVSGGVLTLTWGAASATTNNVIWKAGARPCDPSSTTVSSASYNNADAAAASPVPGTAGQFKETSITLTMTGATPGDFLALFVGRDADAGGDTAVGNARLLSAQFSYTS